jgi:hypothetical protein
MTSRLTGFIISRATSPTIAARGINRSYDLKCATVSEA